MVEERGGVTAGHAEVSTPRARRTVTMTLDFGALGAAVPIPGQGQGPRSAGRTGAQVASHLAVLTLTLPTRSVSPASLVLVRKILEHTGSCHGNTVRTALPLQAHHFLSLLAGQAATLGVPADHLTSLAGAELAARPVPHVSMVTQRAVVETRALDRHAFLTALAGPAGLRLTLWTGDVWAGVCVTARLSTVTHTCGAGIFLPLFSMLVLFSSRQTGVGDTLRTAAPGSNHQVLLGLTGDWLALGSRAGDVAVLTDTPGAGRGAPHIPMTVELTLHRAGGSSVDTEGAAVSSGGAEGLVGGAEEGRAGERGAGNTPLSTHTLLTGRGAPLAVVSIGESLVLTGAARRRHTLWTAAITWDSQPLALLVVTAGVGAVGGQADGDVTIASAGLTCRALP